MEMTPKEFGREMLLIESRHRSGDRGRDGSHRDADALRSRASCLLGYEDGVAVFKKLDKRYS